jgi:hypothetical protein
VAGEFVGEGEGVGRGRGCCTERLGRESLGLLVMVQDIGEYAT